MNFKHIFASLLVASAAFVTPSCDKEEAADQAPTATLELSSQVAKISNAGGESDIIEITTNSQWSIEIDDQDSWLSVDSSSGTRDAEILFSAAANTLEKELVATVIVRVNESLFKEIVVTQQAKEPEVFVPTLQLSSLSASIASEGGDANPISITSNSDWSVEIDSNDAWLSVDYPNGSGNSSIIFSAVASELETEKIATVVVKVSDELKYEVVVTQAAKGSVVEPDLPSSDLAISSPEELQAFAAKVNAGDNFAGKTVILSSDIDLAGQAWTAIGNQTFAFMGTFDGCNHKVSGISIIDGGEAQGFIGKTISATVKNVTVAGSVSANLFVGGVVGFAVTSTIENCHNQATVTASATHVGGVVGLSDGNSTVKSCSNSGTISGQGEIGGVVGLNCNSLLYNSQNSGSVSGLGNVGGIAGNSNNSSSVVFNCVNSGSVSVEGGNVGGIVGNNNTYSTVANSINIGEVTGSGNIGGVIGNNNNFATMTNVINTASVSGGGNQGGVAAVSIASSSAVSCYFLKSSTINSSIQGVADNQDAAGSTIIELTSESLMGDDLITDLNDKVASLKSEDSAKYGELCSWAKGDNGPVLE